MIEMNNSLLTEVRKGSMDIKRNKTNRIFLLIGTILLLTTGCMFKAPETVWTNKEQPQTFNTQSNNFIQPVSYNGKFRIASAPEPEILHFPLMVTTQTLKQIDKTPNGQHLTVNLVTGTPDTDSIKIPASGLFKIIFTGGGGRLVITDNDATDGEARVSMPSGVFDGYIQTRGQPNNFITYQDPLYYVKQDLGRETSKPIWWRIGKRVFPIPADWHNDDGVSYILTLTNSGITNVSTRWYPTSGEPDYPVGIKKIGTEGGILEFPGVGKIEIPQGALTQPTVIVMKQLLEFKADNGRDWDGKIYRANDYVSPIVKIEPMGLKLNKTGRIWLTTDKARVGNNTPALIQWDGSINEKKWEGNEEEWDDVHFAEPLPTSFEQWTDDLPGEVKKLKIFFKYFPADVSPDEHLDRVTFILLLPTMLVISNGSYHVLTQNIIHQSKKIKV